MDEITITNFENCRFEEYKLVCGQTVYSFKRMVNTIFLRKGWEKGLLSALKTTEDIGYVPVLLDSIDFKRGKIFVRIPQKWYNVEPISITMGYVRLDVNFHEIEKLEPLPYPKAAIVKSISTGKHK